MDVYITGVGVVSSIGVGKEATLQSLLCKESGIRPVRYLRTEHKEFPVGEVQLSDEEMCVRLGIDSSTVPTTRTSLMGMLALEEALAEAKIEPDDLPQIDLIHGTTVGGMDKSERYYLDFISNDLHNEYIGTHDCGACTEMIAAHFGKFRKMTTISTACSSAANVVMIGTMMIKNGETDCVVVGGSECLTKFHLNGFNSLMILDHKPCRPFDESRSGLNLGEGSAWLVLESEQHARQRGAAALAVVAGYGNACDAFHQTATSPNGDGPYLAMRQALQVAGVDPGEVDYINAHGTATQNNDISESNAVRRLFGDKVPPISSTKAFTGHTTSASGTVEAAICLLAMQHQFLPVNLRFSKEGDCLRPVTDSKPTRQIKTVMCNAFGFGGNDSALLLKATANGNHLLQKSSAPVYLLAAEQISAQEPLSDSWMTNPIKLEEPFSLSREADYKQFIAPIEARRMGKILKRAIATSKAALAKSGIDIPDAIITGTGLGCIENTELFLDALCHEGEEVMMPTRFMQSTHNTISSLVAIQLKAHGYNVTYAHNTISFEIALMDALLQLKVGSVGNVLVGGHDELTPSYFNLLGKSGYLGGKGSHAGECAASLVLSTSVSAGQVPLCEIAGIELRYKPSLAESEEMLDGLIEECGIGQQYSVMTGENGDKEHDKVYYTGFATRFEGHERTTYKQWFGESYSAPALGIYAAAKKMQAEEPDRRTPTIVWHQTDHLTLIVLKPC